MSDPGMIANIKNCFDLERVLYSEHAKDEMESEEFGEITDIQVVEAISSGKLIEDYPEDEPYPSCLVFGTTRENRPLHIVCAYDRESDTVIIVTVYEPDPTRWRDFERRR